MKFRSILIGVAAAALLFSFAGVAMADSYISKEFPSNKVIKKAIKMDHPKVNAILGLRCSRGELFVDVGRE